MTDSKPNSIKSTKSTKSTNTAPTSTALDNSTTPDDSASAVTSERTAAMPTPKEKTGSSTSSGSGKSSGKGLALFAIILSLLALAGSAFTWYQNQVLTVQNESKLSLGVSEIGGQVSRLGDSISRIQLDQANVVTQANLDTSVLKIQGQLDKKIGKLERQQVAQGDSLNKINTDLQKGVNQYMVDEVSQLLRLANNSVLFGDDIQSAINALQLADEQLKSLTDPRYAKVRSQINAELVDLRSVKQADIPAVSSALDSLQKSIPSLPLANEPEAKLAPVAAAPVAAEITWRTELKKLWKDMLSSVQIQRVDKPAKPLLAPEQRYFLDKNIQLSLASANLALMQGNHQIYIQNLTTAAQWLSDYYDLTDSRVSVTNAQLNSLMGQAVSTSMPDITGSYQALQSINGGK